MAHIESFTTAGLDPRRKVAFWNDHISESLTPMVSDPTDARVFEGSISRVAIGDMSLSEVCSGAQRVYHSKYHASRAKQPTIFLQLQLEGDSMTRQDGRESILHAGDFALVDSTRQYDMQFTGANRMLVLGIPSPTLRRQVGAAESLSTIPMPGERGGNRLLSQLLRGYWDEYHRGLDEEMGRRISTVILDLIAAVFAELPQALADRSSLATAHRVRIVNFIQAHLHDPELTPARVAEACRITVRYLHYLFTDQEETVARYILRRRLEGSARVLESRAQRCRTVTAIAFDHGFNSNTHFGRVFKERFNMTPREYRSEKAGLR